jgi:hypothetical protein
MCRMSHAGLAGRESLAIPATPAIPTGTSPWQSAHRTAASAALYVGAWLPWKWHGRGNPQARSAANSRTPIATGAVPSLFCRSMSPEMILCLGVAAWGRTRSCSWHAETTCGADPGMDRYRGGMPLARRTTGSVLIADLILPAYQLRPARHRRVSNFVYTVVFVFRNADSERHRRGNSSLGEALDR